MPYREKNPPVSLKVSSISGGDLGLFVEGEVDNVHCKLVVDTGANVTIIRPDVMRQTGKQCFLTTPTATLQTVTGDTIKVYGKINVIIRFGQRTYQHEAYVADIKDHCILGLDFLRKFNFCMDLGRNKIFTADEEVLLFGASEEEFQSYRVLAMEECTVPARSECVLKGKCEKLVNCVGVTEVPSQDNMPKGVMVAASLVDLSKITVPVRVVNLSDSDRVIRKGEEVSKCVPVTSVIKSTDSSGSDKLDNLLASMSSSLHLDPEEVSKARNLIAEFKDLFSSSSNELGHTSMTQHRIDTGNHSPIKQHPRRLPFSKRNDVRDMLLKMQQSDVIEPSTSPWSSPIVLVKKKDGSTRFCVDYRKLNEITRKDSYPLPRIDDTIDSLTGHKWFSTLDLKSGYWQVEVHPEDREKTAFTAGDQGLWQFKVMPFGLCNAPATFERLMDSVLQGLSCEACLVYLDDIIIVGRSFQEHLENLRAVLTRLRQANLKLNPNKCNLFRTEVTYLGHVISREGVRTDPEKISAVKSWPRPENANQLRSFLGLCTYYRRFVRNFSRIARPLHRLTEVKQKYEWTTACEDAFQTLKRELTSSPILVYPQLEKPFIVDTDASNEGIGAVLSQETKGVEHVVAYFSKSLSKPERNYCTTRKELLAIVKSVEHFHHYLYGRKFLLRTDHASLSWLLNFKSPEGQVARWIQRLQEYDFEIQHRKGASHGNADALSRRPCPTDCRHCTRAEDNFECFKPVVRQVASTSDPLLNSWNDQNLRQSQLEDSDIKPILEFLESDSARPVWQAISSFSPTTKRYWALWNSLHLQNGVLYRKWESDDGKTSRWQLILPKSRIPEVLRELHNGATGGHFGLMKTLQKVRERFYWDKIRNDVEQWCKSCNQCAARKGPSKRTRGRLQRYNVGAPFERIALDILGPLPVTNNQNKYILVVMDYFSKWPEAYSIPDQEASTVSEVLVREWVSRFGVPLLIHSDQGTNFKSAIFKGMCDILGMEKTQTTPLHPQSDGMVERFNRTVLNHLSIFVSKNQKDWDQKLSLFLLAYRSAVHEATGYTPAQLLFGRDLRLPCDLLFGCPKDAPSSPVEYLQNLQERLEAIHHFTREKIDICTEKMKLRYDAKSNHRDFKVNDKVWFWNPKRNKGLSPKLQHHWEGPYTIMHLLNDVNVRIRKTASSKPKVVHIDRLAPYFGS